MKNLYHSLLLLIAGSTQKELASQIRYLKIEYEVLRFKLPKRISVTEKERNIGSKLGKALNELVTIVHPETLRRWTREARNRAKRTLARAILVTRFTVQSDRSARSFHATRCTSLACRAPDVAAGKPCPNRCRFAGSLEHDRLATQDGWEVLQ